MIKMMSFYTCICIAIFTLFLTVTSDKDVVFINYAFKNNKLVIYILVKDTGHFLKY